MYHLQEKINPYKYNGHIESLYGKLKHMIVNEVDLQNVVEISTFPNTDRISSMYINARVNVDNRLVWKNGREEGIAGTLSCTETIELDEDTGTYIHTYLLLV